MPHTPAAKAFTELILETFRFNSRLLAAGDRIAKPLGLTSARWQVLGAIEEQSLPVAQIARNMGLARQNVQRLSDALAAEGVVEYAPNENHRRAKLVCLTDKGRQAVNALTQRQVLWANRVVDGAGVSEIQSALGLVKKLRTRLEKERPD